MRVESLGFAVQKLPNKACLNSGGRMLTANLQPRNTLSTGFPDIFPRLHSESLRQAFVKNSVESRILTTTEGVAHDSLAINENY